MRLARRPLLGLGLALPACGAWADNSWPSALVMGTGRPGGDYMIYGPEWGQLVQAQTHLQLSYRSSGGAEANILLIDENAAQLGLATITVAHEARYGSSSWTAGVQFQSFRALFPMYPSILQIISPRATGIATLAELAGQDIGIGPQGGSGAATVPAIFASVGVIPKNAILGDYIDQINDMLAGKLAACAFIGAPPLPAIARAAMGNRLSLIGFSAAESAQVARVLPGITPMILGAGSFPGQTTAVASVGTGNIAIGATNLPDSLAKAVTAVALANRAAFAKLVPAAAVPPDINCITGAGVTFHPGAAQALREAGLTVPKKYIEP